MKYWQILVGLMLVIGIALGLTKVDKVDKVEEVEVVDVVDGDTIEVKFEDNKKERIRLIGIDAPEISSENKECFGQESYLGLKEFLENKDVTLESDPTQKNRDEYGRLLRYVYINDENINKTMIEKGFAYELTFMGKTYNYQSEFVESEEKAKEEKKGLWKSC